MNLSFLALRRSAILTVTMLLAFALAACSSGDGDASEPAAGSSDAGGGSGTATVSGGAVEITAADLEFSAATIEATAGEAFTITFVNNDTQPHNISFYTEEGGERLVEGAVINAGETVEVQVDALDAGEYYFRCDIHPDMNGSVVVG
ncbi:MAG: cupredoxin domain-containing protein [Candidatus Limnocylindria bacterium]